MNLKVRRLLRGLRYISHVFGEGEEKNEEMRIGFPTDVKHVAHIGRNASSVASRPSWMKEFKEGNGGIESDTLVAYAHTIEGISSIEESFGSSSQQVIKTRAKLHPKQHGIRRRKDGAPMRHKANTSNTQLSDEDSIKPKKTRRRKKKVIKKAVAIDDGSLRSSATSSNPNSASSTDDSGNLDKSKCGSIYKSAHEASDDDEGSPESYGTVACVFERDL